MGALTKVHLGENAFGSGFCKGCALQVSARPNMIEMCTPRGPFWFFGSPGSQVAPQHPLLGSRTPAQFQAPFSKIHSKNLQVAFGINLGPWRHQMEPKWETRGVSIGGEVALLWLGSAGSCKTKTTRGAIARVMASAQPRVALDPPRHFMAILAKCSPRPPKYLVKGRSSGRTADNETASMDSAEHFEVQSTTSGRTAARHRQIQEIQR